MKHIDMLLQHISASEHVIFQVEQMQSPASKEDFIIKIFTK